MPENINVMVQSPKNDKEIKKLLKNALTDEINSREMFIKVKVQQ